MADEIPVRGGRKGQQHRATPDDLRSYTVPPASPVTVTRADGEVETRPAKAPRKTTATSRRRGPAVCALCAGPIGGTPWTSREPGPCQGKPVHPECEKRPGRRPTGPERLSLVEENRQLRAQQDRIRPRRRRGRTKK